MIAPDDGRFVLVHVACDVLPVRAPVRPWCRETALWLTAMAQLVEEQPATATEAMLAAQKIATHHLVMTTLARATAPGQTDEVLDRHVARASRLMQLFCMQTTRRNTPCQCPAMRNRRRCRLHGGPSTGPRTPEGLARSRRARWKHGEYSREARDARRIAQRQWREIWALLTPIHPAIPR